MECMHAYVCTRREGGVPRAGRQRMNDTKCVCVYEIKGGVNTTR